VPLNGRCQRNITSSARLRTCWILLAPRVVTACMCRCSSRHRQAAKRASCCSSSLYRADRHYENSTETNAGKLTTVGDREVQFGVRPNGRRRFFPCPPLVHRIESIVSGRRRQHVCLDCIKCAPVRHAKSSNIARAPSRDIARLRAPKTRHIKSIARNLNSFTETIADVANRAQIDRIMRITLKLNSKLPNKGVESLMDCSRWRSVPNGPDQVLP
jgi:hypothetical protein